MMEKIRRKITKVAIGENATFEELKQYNDIRKHNLKIQKIHSGIFTKLKQNIIKNQYDLVLIDYLQILPQLINSNLSNSAGERERIKENILFLMDVSISTGACIVAAAQFNRDGSKNPELTTLRDIREAADIEHAGSVVLSLWNTSEPYNEIKGNKQALINKEDRNGMYVRVLKDRDFIYKGENKRFFRFIGGRAFQEYNDEYYWRVMTVEKAEKISQEFRGERSLMFGDEDLDNNKAMHQRKANQVANNEGFGDVPYGETYSVIDNE